jgi:hypothetical protein
VNGREGKTDVLPTAVPTLPHGKAHKLQAVEVAAREVNLGIGEFAWRSVSVRLQNLNGDRRHDRNSCVHAANG